MIPPQTNEIDGIKHYSFASYPSYFVRTYATNLLSIDPSITTNLVWKFKNGIDQDWPLVMVSHEIHRELQALTLAGMSRDNIALVCLPASTNTVNEQRHRNFSHKLCEFLGLQNGFDYITIINPKEPKYGLNGQINQGGIWNMAQDLAFNQAFFAGKDVILFDDIVTSGDTMRDFINKMRELGANPLLCLSLLYTPKIF